MIEHLDDKTFEQVLVKERIAVVKVWATWCGPCKFMESHFRRWSNQMVKISDIDIPYFSVDNDNNPKFLDKCKVEVLPTILIMVHGVVVYKMQGIMRQTVLEDFIRKALRVKIEYEDGENAED
jgi:thioredoxin 1